ncbi:pilus biogenesis initiator-like protein [Shimwellia blattae DSM 4481 = NBRC 105725]|uniref:Pilus biogenesis initiator-like protein n=2 Tax=Shimwellia blattae TaxID=563 RepID=I2B4V0_SHIBC|nr:pilus biogenesis initiator-like protein [Shimwellia blattae DSM 4481 = NBRC 105725]VDY63036.1 Colonization factor antigen I subunit E [Shimwellia blattae]VEC20172.1 Colonization factor antigen I subunit E [Shimwellia blattae]
MAQHSSLLYFLRRFSGQFLRRHHAALLWALLLIFSPFTALQASTGTGAMDNTINPLLHTDKSVPVALTLWNQARGGSDSNPAMRGTDGWVCLSNTNPRHGACATDLEWRYAWGESSVIKLAFTEQRSGMVAVLELRAQSAFYADPPHHCAPISRAIPVNHVSLLGCDDGLAVKYYNGKVLSVSLDAAQVARLPVGGRWQAELILHQRAWGAAASVATWRACITLEITDKDNGAIYLPGRDPTRPLVRLGLHPIGHGDLVAGQQVIDTCLYDGYNANSPWLSVTLSDLLPTAGRSAETFSVVHHGHSPASTSNRIDYRVALGYGGRQQVMRNGQPLRLTATDREPVHSVTLPGIPQPVACVPAPLTLTVAPFNPSIKNPGHYEGTLRIMLAAESLAP